MLEQMRLFDPHPGEWSFPLFRLRAEASLLPYRYFYEELAHYDDIVKVLYLDARLAEAGLPPQGMHHLQIVLDVFPSMFSSPLGRLPTSEPAERSIGRHAVTVIGYDNEGDGLVFQNSYGSTWGDDGCGVVSREYCRQYLREAWASSIGPGALSVANYDRVILDGATGMDLVKAYLEENPVRVGNYWAPRRGFEYRTYSVLSLGSECVVDVIEAQEVGAAERAPWTRQGWVHIYYGPGTDAHLRELFVLPSSRRRGLGTALVALATRMARRHARRRLMIDLHDADAFGPGLDAARAFASRRGCKFQADIGTNGDKRSRAVMTLA